MHSSCSMKKEFHGFVIIVVIEKMIRTFLGKCDTKFIIPGIWWYVSCLKTFCFVYYTSIISGTNKFEILVMGICLVENVIQEDIYIYIIVWNLDCSTLYESLVSKMEMEDIFHSWIFLDEIDRRAWYFSYIVNDKYSLKNNSGNLFSKKKFINCNNI